MRCDLCGREFHPNQVRRHRGSKNCQIDALSVSLLDRGLLPYPPGHSLPAFVPVETHVTRAEYSLAKEGKFTADKPTVQCWAPKWVRIVTEEASKRATDVTRGIEIPACNKEDRDLVLLRLLGDEEAQRAILSAYALDGAHGAAELVWSEFCRLEQERSP